MDQQRRTTITSVEDHPQALKFLEHLRNLSREQLEALYAEKRRFLKETSDDDWEKWAEARDTHAKLSASVSSQLRSQVRKVTSEQLDIDDIQGNVRFPAKEISQTAIVAIQGILSREKISPGEYLGFIGPYLAAGFPREIFYPEEA